LRPQIRLARVVTPSTTKTARLVGCDGTTISCTTVVTFGNDRATVFDVDSTSGQDDRLYQDVEVSVGQQYLFSFDYYGPNQVAGVSEPASNDFEVY